MASDPNFPENLDIKPLDAPKTNYGASVAAFDEDFNLQAQQDAIVTYGIAGRVWEASYPMIMYLNPPPYWLFDPPLLLKGRGHRPYSLLELGSGTGIAASCMAEILKDGDQLIVTDLPEVCPLLKKNLSKHFNKSFSLAVRPLAWGNSEHAQKIQEEFNPLELTHIVCSDLVYFPELLAPLLRSLLQVTSRDFINPDDEPTVIISYMIRSMTKEAPFWSAFGLWFDFQPVSYLPPADSTTDDESDEGSEWRRFGSEQEDQVFVFVAKRRPESHSWRVPEDNQELLHGVGANGTDVPKSDDTFETLLLLSMDD